MTQPAKIRYFPWSKICITSRGLCTSLEFMLQIPLQQSHFWDFKASR